MGSIRTIATIARFEAIILFRSWFFRIFTVLILLFLLGMNIGILSETNSNWIIRALPANIPYFNMVFLNTAMTFIAMFLAIDFLRRDKKLDTSEVIYTRSMTNWDYVWGKTIGVLTVFLIVHLLVLLMALIINLSIPTAGLDLNAYFYYPLLISVPSLVFIMGFSFMIMSLVRNQAIALVVLLGYAGLVMFTAKDRFDYLFDFIGMRMPMMHSDFVGFGFEPVLFTQRAIYLTLGIAMIFGSVLLMKRLPQSKARTLFAWIMTGVFGIVGLSLAIGYYSSYQRNENYRDKLVALNDQYSNYSAGKLKHTQIDVTQEDAGLGITATLRLAFGEEADLKKAVFSLNPGFELLGITSGGKAVNYTREEHLALCDVSGLVDDNRELSLTFTYQGRADERLAYLDIDRKQIEEKYGPDFVVGIRKRYGFTEKQMVLLTPELVWLPVPGVGHGSGLNVLPEWNFSHFTGTIKTFEGLTPVVMGIVSDESGTWNFETEHPVPGLTLIIGPYVRQSVEVDGTTYHLAIKEGHDHFSASLSLLKDTLPDLIREMRADLERNLAMKYPENTLTLVEVPVQFYSYARLFTNSSDYIQPALILVPEKAGMLSRADFEGEIKNQIKRNEERDMAMSDQEIQARVLRNFLMQNFSPTDGGGGDFRMRMDGPPMQMGSSGTKPYSVFPMFLNYVNHFEARDFPVLNTAFEAYMNSQSSSSGFFGGFGGATASERANMALLSRSLKDIIEREEDYDLVRDVIQSKGVFLFTYLEALAGTVAFRDYLEIELQKHRYETIMLRDFARSYQEAFGIDLGSFASEWYNASKLPGFLVTGLRVIEMQEGDRTRFQLLFKISNPTDADGVVKITIRAGRGGGMGRGGGGGGGGGFAMAGRNSDNERLYHLKAGEARQIGMILDDQPRGMSINTLVSVNIPNNISFPFPEVEKIRNYEAFESETLIPTITSLRVEGEYVVDNEDPGFKLLQTEHKSRLAKWLNINKDKDGLKYETIRSWRPPLEWTATTNSMFYGEFIRSAYYTRSGEGERVVEWSTTLDEPGYYEVFTYANPMIARMGMRGRGGGGPGGGPGGSPPEIVDEYHFQVYHDDGVDDIAFSLQNASNGWNSLGSFYLSAGEVKVQLNNRNKGKMVSADAVKWVKQK